MPFAGFRCKLDDAFGFPVQWSCRRSTYCDTSVVLLRWNTFMDLTCFGNLLRCRVQARENKFHYKNDWAC